MNYKVTKVIGIVCGEHSGDSLGADLIREMKLRNPNVQFIGIGGPKMIKEGLILTNQMSTLSVMGFVKVIKRLPKIYSLYKHIFNVFIKEKIDLFIGIDAPDFNLRLEKKLKKNNIKTIHYVSPTIWIWRPNRIYSIMEACDAVLCIFPNEPVLYKQHGFPAYYVGHPLAKNAPLINNKKELKLGSDSNIQKYKKVITMFPGSREEELSLIGSVMIDSAIDIYEAIKENLDDDLLIIIHAIDKPSKKKLEEKLQNLPQYYKYKNYIKALEGNSKDYINASDFVIAKSGTIAFEASLMKRPLVVVYKTHVLNYFIITTLKKLGILKFIEPFFASIINYLAGGYYVIPELVQNEVNKDNLVKYTVELFNNKSEIEKQINTCTEIHNELLNNMQDKTDIIEKYINS